MIPVADVRLSLGIGEDDDGLLEHLVEQATEVLGRELLEYLGPPEEFVDQLTVKCCEGRHKVRLHRLPIAVSKVEQRRSPFLPYEEVAADDGSGQATWVVADRDVISRSGFYPGAEAVRVTYTSGYQIGAGPGELQAVVEALVIAKYRELKQQGTDETGALKQETLGDYTYVRFTPAELEGIAGFRDVRRRWRRMLI